MVSEARINKTFRLLLTIFISAFASNAVRCQSDWEELRTFGISSYTSTAIRALAIDKEYKIVYAPIGKEVYRWKGGNTLWQPISTAAPLNADGIIYTTATDRSHNVYAAGWFSNQDGRYYVAKATYSLVGDKYTWTELGGVNGLNASGPIYSVITDATGNVYAAGSFLSTTGWRYVAKWNGTSWTELGVGAAALMANGYINALCTDSVGNIYAAGEFTNAAGKKYVAKWNGSNWSELGAGVNALNASAAIKSIGCDLNGNIYAAVVFVNPANKPYVAKWDGNTWSELGAGSNALNANGDIYTLSIDLAGNVYAAGDFTNAGANRYVARWDGAIWSEPGADIVQDVNEAIYATAIDNKYGFRLFAAGNFTNHYDYKFVKDYNITTDLWSETAPSPAGTIEANKVAQVSTGISTDTLYALGCPIAKWDDKGWSLANANYCMSGLVIDDAGSLYASGKFDNSYCNYVSKWNGTSWVDLGNSYPYFRSMNPDNTISKMVTDAAGNIYLTGNYKNASQKYFVAWFNGVSWTELGTGAASLGSDEELSGLTIDGNGNIYVCAYKYFYYHIAKWNGTAWTFLESSPSQADLPLDKINSIAADNAGNLYSTFTSWSGSYLRKWDGVSWSIISPMHSAFFTIDAYNNLYTIEGTTVKILSGGNWTVLGDSSASFRASRFLSIDRKGNLYTVGSWDNGNTFGIARHRRISSIALCNPSANTDFTNSLVSTAYQWQVSTTGASFTNIANNTNYAGVTSKTLQLTNIPSSWNGYQYRCIADGTSSKVFSLQFVTRWIGTGTDENSSAWQNAANWSCGVVPDLNTDVIITSGNVTIAGNAFCGSLSLSPQANFTVNAGASLTITR